MRSPALMAEFDSGPALVAAVGVAHAGGLSKLDTFTPYEVEGLQEALHLTRSRLPWITLAVAIVAGATAYFVEWWINVVNYPLDVGGRPLHSAPAFIPIAFEMAVLFGGLATLLSALVLGGLPRLWHPVFEVEGFERATIDRFWLAVDRDDPALDRARASSALEAAGALRVVWLGVPS